MLDISQPTRQSKLSILLYLFKGIKGLIAFVFFAAFSMRSWTSTLAVIGVSTFVVIATLISPVLKYLFFKFHVEKDELIIQKGWLFKERKAIPIDRIQSINITQNVVQRVLGLVAVEIDTAGSKAKELEIPALDRHFAEQLKSLLGKKKKEVQLTDVVQIDESGEVINEELKHQETVSKSILKLDIIDLLKVGITQNHLRSGGLAIGVVIGFWYKIKDVVENYFGDIFESVEVDMEQAVKAPESFGTSVLVFLSIGVVSFIIVSVIVSLIMAINKFYDYEMKLKDDYLEITMGLLNKKEIKIPLSKIQILEFHSNPLRKLLGFKTARLFQAQTQNNQVSNVEVPACHPDLQKQLQHLIFNEPVEQPEKVLLPNPWSHARFDMYVASAFAVPLIAVAAYFEYYWAIAIPLLFVLFIGFMGYKYGSNSKVLRDDDFVVFYKGWLFNSVIISPVYKTQAVEKWRSIFIKRRGEAHLQVHTAGGSRQLKYLKATEINAMQNDINNAVIQSSKSWM
ncbi:MAG: PH domain-containing protein [Nonlabens sp.]|uniref:PH domain-containing protein n=1 Tax=Nonlabens sp. TaxID=1888209 RepID=UPI003EF87A5B